MSLWNLKRPRLRVFGLRTQVIIVSPWNLKYRQLKREASVSSNKKCIEKGAMCKHDSLQENTWQTCPSSASLGFLLSVPAACSRHENLLPQVFSFISILYQKITFFPSSLQNHRMSCSPQLYSHKMSHSEYITHIRR